jgi:integrase
LLEVCDERVKALILLLASTGVRIRAIVDLKLQDLVNIPTYDLYQVKVYSDSNQSYFTFSTPEAAKAINTYLSYRERYGEKLTPKSPVFRGLTVAATMTQSALAGGGSKKNRHDKYVKRGQNDYKKDGNGNTNTAQILKQNAKASKFSIVEQNGENSICTHPSSSSEDLVGTNVTIVPGEAGTCTSQSNQPLEVP